MIDSILIGMSGLDSFSEGLRVISNNSTNLNTPGFKGSSTQFGDLFFADGGVAGGQPGQTGYGVTTLGTQLNFQQGEMQSDGKPLDLGVDGEGLFTLRDDQGALHYTRAGQFHFDANGVLVDATGSQKVVGVDASGAQADFAMDGHRTNPAQATKTVVLEGIVDNTVTSLPGQPTGTPSPETPSLTVLDSTGRSHTLTATLTFDNSQVTDPQAVSQWTLTISDGTTPLAFSDGSSSATLEFDSHGKIIASSAKPVASYKPAGAAEMPVTLDFSDVTTASGSNVVQQSSKDGYLEGTLTNATFDETGTIVYAYSNGQTVKGNQLQLARFDSTDTVKAVGSNEFDATDPSRWHVGTAGADGFGSIRSSVVELSNVDLSQEFSDLVIMQRGYQASSQVVSTANDMLQELFSMSGNK